MSFHLPSFIKEHPVAVGAGALFVFVVVYLLSSSGSATSGSSSSAETNALLSAEEQNSQQQAQLQLASLQAQVSNNNTIAQASVANNQIAAQLNAANNSTAAQLQALTVNTAGNIAATNLNDTAQLQAVESTNLTQQNLAAISANENTYNTASDNATQTNLANISASSANYQVATDAAAQEALAETAAQSTDYQVASNNAAALGTVQANDAVLNNQLTEAAGVNEYDTNAQLQALMNGNATNVQLNNAAYGYLNNVNSSQQQVATLALGDQQAITQQQLLDQYNTANGVLNVVGSGATNKGGQAGATTAGILETILGASPSSANQVAAANTVSSNNVLGTLIGTLGKAGNTVLSGLFS